MQPQELRDLIKKTLDSLNLYSPGAEELLMATCAQESHLGVYRRQINGPALGIFQMEPEDFKDIWLNYLAYKPNLSTDLSALASSQPPRPVEMVMNDAFAIAMARVHYLRAPGLIPDPTDLTAIWNYYKQHYNTPQGAATQAEFVANYRKYVNGSAV